MTDNVIGRLIAALTPRRLLLLLLAMDLLLIALFLGHRLYGWPASHRFNIGIDQSIPELFQYLKQLAMCTVLFIVFLRDRVLAALFWSALAALMFLDDAFQAHEKLGSIISTALSLPDIHGIRGQDFGEVVAAAVLAAPLLLGIAWCFFRDGPRMRRFTGGMLALLALLGMFGVVIDLFVHKLQSLTLYVIEDGGEMIVMSLMLAYVWAFYLATIGRRET